MCEKYDFDFDNESPIPQPHSSMKYTPIQCEDLPLYLLTDKISTRAKPLIKVDISKDEQTKRENQEARESFSTQTSTFVGDRLSTFHLFDQGNTDRSFRVSFLPSTDRSDDLERENTSGHELEALQKEAFEEQKHQINPK